jgi:hypothetical protein
MKAWVALATLGVIGFGLVETGTLHLPEIGSVTKFMRPAPSLSLPRVELKSLRSEYGFLQGSFVISNTNAFPIADATIHSTCMDQAEPLSTRSISLSTS